MKIIAYYRVSTKQQGESGLGLEGQVATVAAYARGQGAEVLKTYREVESGKRADRPELAKALAHARRSRATLVIAKLDRLARNVHFLSGLMESNVDFIACDNPHANKLTIHILAAVAEDEAQRISARTKAALAAYRARGGLLGGAAGGPPAHPGARRQGPGASPRGPAGRGRGGVRRPGWRAGRVAGRRAVAAHDRRAAQRRRAHHPPRQALEPRAGRPGPRAGQPVRTFREQRDKNQRTSALVPSRARRLLGKTHLSIRESESFGLLTALFSRSAAAVV